MLRASQVLWAWFWYKRGILFELWHRQPGLHNYEAEKSNTIIQTISSQHDTTQSYETWTIFFNLIFTLKAYGSKLQSALAFKATAAKRIFFSFFYSLLEEECWYYWRCECFGWLAPASLWCIIHNNHTLWYSLIFTLFVPTTPDQVLTQFLLSLATLVKENYHQTGASQWKWERWS